MDKIRIVSGQLGDFSTAPWGVLKVVDGKVILDRAKALNRSRQMLNAGANTIRILRRNQWSSPVPFDIDDEGYWPMFKEFIGIIHQPYQNGGSGAGADIHVEIFDNCSDDKSWMYDSANYDRARSIIRAMFTNLGDLPYVKFGIGNEIDSPGDSHFGQAFVRDCVYPEFRATGRVPYSLGGTYIRQNPLGSKGPLEWQAYEAENAFGYEAMLTIFRPVHGVKDETSQNLIDTVQFWMSMNNPIRVAWSTDGIWDGDNPCDWTTYNGMIQRRPSVEQIKHAVRYWIDRAQSFALPTGQPKFSFEILPKVVNNDECVTKSIETVSSLYADRFGILPENYGQYQLDWVEPPAPPEPPIPPIPPTTDCKCRYWLTEPSRPDFRRWMKCLFGGKKRCK